MVRVPKVPVRTMTKISDKVLLPLCGHTPSIKNDLISPPFILSKPLLQWSNSSTERLYFLPKKVRHLQRPILQSVLFRNNHSLQTGSCSVPHTTIMPTERKQDPQHSDAPIIVRRGTLRTSPLAQCTIHRLGDTETYI